MTFIPRRLADNRICCSSPDSLCDECREHFTDSSDDAPDPYAGPISTIRAAESRPESFEDEWKRRRAAELAAERTELVSEQILAGFEERPIRVLSEDDVSAYEPPDPYGPGVAALRAKEQRR
jgi:hypothetical protein